MKLEARECVVSVPRRRAPGAAGGRLSQGAAAGQGGPRLAGLCGACDCLRHTGPLQGSPHIVQLHAFSGEFLQVTAYMSLHSLEPISCLAVWTVPYKANLRGLSTDKPQPWREKNVFCSV